MPGRDHFANYPRQIVSTNLTDRTQLFAPNDQQKTTDYGENNVEITIWVGGGGGDIR